MTEIPPHLLKRATDARQRAAAQAEPEAAPMSEGLTFADSLDERLAIIVDTNSQPCSLLADHVATATRTILDYATRNVGRYSYEIDPALFERTVLHTADQDPQNVFFVGTQIAKTLPQEGSVITSLELVREAKPKFRYTRFLKEKRLNSLELPNENQAYLLATVRSEIAIPVLGIRTAGKEEGCSFVHLLGDSVYDTGELVVTSHDQTVTEKEVALSSLRKLLEYYLEEGGRYNTSFSVPLRGNSKLFDRIGATERVHDVLGELDQRVEHIVALVQLMTDEGKQSQSMDDEVTLGRNNYPATLHMRIERTDTDEPGSFKVHTSLKLKNSSNFGTQPIFPTLTIRKALGNPLQFEGIDPSSEEHQKMVTDFSELVKDMWKKNQPPKLSLSYGSRQSLPSDKQDAFNATLDQWELP